MVCDRAGHSNSLCFAGIHGYFSLAQSHISMQTEGREAEERPGVWCPAKYEDKQKNWLWIRENLINVDRVEALLIPHSRKESF